MTCFVPAYDTEKPVDCLEACRTITQVHHERGVPATFFVVGRLLEDERDLCKELLDEPTLFEVASHTYSHKLLRDHAVCGPAVDDREIRHQIYRSKELVEEVFGRECLGLRPACAFDVGLKGAPALVAEMVAAGLKYVSSRAWGPHCTVPAPLAGAGRANA